jgi:hypothetical protein
MPSKLKNQSPHNELGPVARETRATHGVRAHMKRTKFLSESRGKEASQAMESDPNDPQSGHKLAR